MKNEIPRLKYRSKSPTTKVFNSIELFGKVIHTINDLSEFFAEFGYELEMAKNGKLPDEFIWETYVKGNNGICASCYQLHLIEYLVKYSVTFTKEYELVCDRWIASHAGIRAACGVVDCAGRK